MRQAYGVEVRKVFRVTQFIFWADSRQAGSKDKATFAHKVEIQFFSYWFEVVNALNVVAILCKDKTDIGWEVTCYVTGG